MTDRMPVRLWRCHWLGMPEVVPLVAARTRGQAKRCVLDHVRDIFDSAVFEDIRAERASVAFEARFLRGDLLPQLIHYGTASATTLVYKGERVHRGEWQ